MDKGENFFRLTGKHFSVALLALLITTVLLLDQDRNPFLSTHDLSTQHQATAPVPVPDCNYAKGKWVADNRPPFYSGFQCKKWLAEEWSCRLTKRTDFSFEKYRWQPNDCEIPAFDRFAFLRRMQDKTIAFIGDSLGRQQFQSLMCMVSAGNNNRDVEDVASEYVVAEAAGSKHTLGWAYRFLYTNTTILYEWSASLCYLVPINGTDPSNSDVAMHLDRPPAFLTENLHRFDVLVLNTDHRWNKDKFAANRWVMYVNGKPNKSKELEDFRNARNFKVQSIIKWLDSQLPAHPTLKVFFRTLSPSHFQNGDWNTGGSCNNTTFTRGSEVLQDESGDRVVEDAVRGTKVKMLDITTISELRDEAHMSNYSIRPTHGINDCLHWCLPGVPDTWNELLIPQL